MALSLNQATIVVSMRNFATYKTFFVGLGLKLIVDEPPHYARFECPGNSATFSIDAIDETQVDLGKHQSQLFFELPSKEALDLYCSKLEQQGYKFKESPEERDRDYLWREAHLVTPENHDIRLYYAGGNRLNPPWRVN